MRTSYSAIETFKTCPLKYKFSVIEKRREPKRAESIFGTIIHSSLKYMFERNPLYPTLDEVIDYFTGKWSDAAQNIQWRNTARKNEEEKIYFDEGIKILKNFYKKNQPWNYNAIGLEERFSVQLFDETTGIEHTLSGIIDRIDKDIKSDVYEIIDYKTGKKMPSEEMLKENLQLGVYALALHNKWPSLIENTIVTSLYFLKHNEKISITPTKEILTATRNGILSAIREIEKRIKTDNFLPTPGPLCNWCGFRNICPMWSHEYKTEKEKSAPDEHELADAVRDFFTAKEAEVENKNKLSDAREKIERYMQSKQIARVFGTGGYITRSEQERISYDIKKIRPILENADKWDDVLMPDQKMIEKIAATLTEAEQEEMSKARQIKKFTILKHSKK